jgi:hypothetical protein
MLRREMDMLTVMGSPKKVELFLVSLCVLLSFSLSLFSLLLFLFTSSILCQTCFFSALFRLAFGFFISTFFGS